MDLSVIVDQWFADSFMGGPVARNTPIYNLVFEAKENLKVRLDPSPANDTPASPSSTLNGDSDSHTTAPEGDH